MKQSVGQKIAYSSSSSDEEEMKKLEAAVWKVDKSNFYHEKKGTTQANEPLPLSKRESLYEASAFTADFRTADTTPEYKNFVAKKLTAYLDGILEDLEEEPKKRPIEQKQARDDSFQLFSTSSKSYVPHQINYPQPKWKREQQKRRKKQGKDSSSSSDSEEEKIKWTAVAVSGDFILDGAKRVLSPHQENMKDGEEVTSPQVTSNQDCFVLTHNASHLDNDPVETSSDTKNKKMKKSKEDIHLLSGISHRESNLVTSNGTDVVISSKKKKKKRKKEKGLLDSVFHDSERLKDNPVDETSSLEKISNVEEEVHSTLMHSNNTAEHGGSEHSSNCKKKKKRKRKKELYDV